MFKNKLKLGIAGLILAGGISPCADVSGAAQVVSDWTTSGPTGTLTQTTATLNGAINQNGLDTTYYFVYGGPGPLNYPTETYPVVDAGSGSSPVSVTAALTGLVPNSTYTAQLAASNSSGFTAGNTVSFTTSWPVASTNGYSSLNLTSAVITGSVNPNGTDSTY